MKALIATALLTILGGCSPAPESGSATSTSPEPAPTTTPPATTPAVSTPKPTSEADDPSTRQPKAGEEIAVLDTSKGRIVLMFFPDKAPKTVENFKSLAKKGFYDGTRFHRVLPGFMIQGGDPNSKKNDESVWGQGGPGYTIPDEFSDVHHVKGIVSMAHSGAPNSGGSQFFICDGDAGFLDGQYSAFGKVVSGLDVVGKIVSVPTKPTPGMNEPPSRPKDPPVLKSVKIEKWPLK